LITAGITSVDISPEQHLQHKLAGLRQCRRLGLHHHPFAHRQSASRKLTRLALDFHHAQSARAIDTQVWVIAYSGNDDTRQPGRIEYGFSGVDLQFSTIDDDFRHEGGLLKGRAQLRVAAKLLPKLMAKVSKCTGYRPGDGLTQAA